MACGFFVIAICLQNAQAKIDWTEAYTREAVLINVEGVPCVVFVWNGAAISCDWEPTK